MDADFSHNPDDVPRLYEACAKDGADLSVGSRYVTGVNVVNWPMGRVLMSYFASKYVRMITGLPVYDTTAGQGTVIRNVNNKEITAEYMAEMARKTSEFIHVSNLLLTSDYYK